MTAIVTKDSLNAMLQAAEPQRRVHIIGRALVALFERQTAAEQSSDSTSNDNGIGFASSDARSGSLTAKSYIARQNLVQWQVDQWMRPSRGYPRICKYARQLNEIAEEKQRKKVCQLEVLKQEYALVVDSDDEKIIAPVVAQLRALEAQLGVQPYRIVGAIA